MRLFKTIALVVLILVISVISYFVYFMIDNDNIGVFITGNTVSMESMIQTNHKIMNKKYKNDFTVLQLAVISHNIDMIRVILTADYNNNCKDASFLEAKNKFAETALDITSRKNYFKKSKGYGFRIKKMLQTAILMKNINKNPNTNDKEIINIIESENLNVTEQPVGQSIFCLLTLSNRTELVEYFLKRGANPNEIIQNDFRSGYARTSTLLQEALKSKEDNKHIIELLLFYGADPNLPSINGDTAFTIASLFCDIDTLKLLVKYKANPRQKDFNGWSALMFWYIGFSNKSNKSADMESLRYLLSLGLNPNDRNNSTGKSFLDAVKSSNKLSESEKNSIMMLINYKD